jgi:glucan 1,3-beta-glucosidase
MKNKPVLFCVVLVLILCGCTSVKKLTATMIPTETNVPTQKVINTQVPTATKTMKPTNVPATSTKVATPTPVLPTLTPTPSVNYRISGINIGPYLNDDPNLGVYIQESDLRRLIEKVAPYTLSIRTFACGNGLDKAAKIAHDLDLTIAQGVWLGKDIEANEKEMACIFNLASSGELRQTDLVIIGNETLLRGDLTERELLIYINRFKAEFPEIPVSSVESWSNIKKYKELISTVDVVSVNIYPYLNNLRVDKAMDSLVDWYKKFYDFVHEISPSYGYTDADGKMVFVSKEIMVTETGWPTCGKNGGTPEQSFYFGAFTSFARAWDIKFYWFEAYDEVWKTKYEGEAGGCWGLWDKDGNLKSSLDVTFSGIVGGEAPPSIVISKPNEFSDPSIARGMAWHVIPKDYRVVLYIKVPDLGWWVKPTFDSPTTEIEDTGYWENYIFTGWNDSLATEVAAFLIPVGYEPPLAAGWDSLPQELYKNSVANTIVDW